MELARILLQIYEQSHIALKYDLRIDQANSFLMTHVVSLLHKLCATAIQRCMKCEYRGPNTICTKFLSRDFFTYPKSIYKQQVLSVVGTKKEAAAKEELSGLG